jgi:hypothetical protein
MIKRYDPESKHGWSEAGMIEDVDGGYVERSDYEDLDNKYEDLNKKYKEALVRIQCLEELLMLSLSNSVMLQTTSPVDRAALLKQLGNRYLK